MNNANGKELLARVRPGDLIAIRLPDGSLATGRAERPDGMERPWMLRIRGHLQLATYENIVLVEPGRG